MRIAIDRSSGGIADGGSFQYELVFLNALGEIATRFPAEFSFTVHPASNLFALSVPGGLNYRGLQMRPLFEPVVQQHPPEAYATEPPPVPDALDPNKPIFDENVARAYRDAGIDFVLQLSPHYAPFVARTPFVVPIFDLNHRIQPEFPEVSAFGGIERREYIHINICRFATFVLVDSEVGKDDVLRFYGQYIGEDRIRVLPYYPPIAQTPPPNAGQLAAVAAKYGLPKRFFFYPAQFWRHKNHELILRAAKLLLDQGEVVPFVFCGAYSDYFRARNFIELRTLASQLRVPIYYVGAVPAEDVAALYCLSAGLVMPTFFGPTNIPPLEAWHYGRPVIASNIRGMREQIGDAGLLVDPRSPADLASALLRLWKDDRLGAELAGRGKILLSAYSWPTYVESVVSLLTEACERVRAGSSPRFPAMPR
jgi:glycosyltransferase involved in cell wall biosynthesis